MIPSRAILSTVGCALLLYELLLVRLLGVVLFGPQAHLAIGIALLGGGVGASLLFAVPSLCARSNAHTRLPQLLILSAFVTALSLLYIANLPLTTIPGELPTTFQERSTHFADIINTPLFIGLLCILIIPFVIGGIVLGAALKDAGPQFPGLYASDLIGSALAAPLFLILLQNVPATDGILLVSAFFLLAASFASRVKYMRLFTVMSVLCIVLVLTISTTSGRELFPLQHAAGYQESTLVYNRWTPISRVSIYQNPNSQEESIVLDNGSASLVVQSTEQQKSMATAASRGLVYALHQPGKAAIIGAGAGPEVSAAQYYGYSDILAIDLVGHIFEVLREQYKDNPFNPFKNDRFHTASGDGRAIVAHTQNFDTIQIVHANLWSLNGMLSNIWSPALLETKEAFHIFLNALNPHGIVSIAKGPDTIRMIPTLLQTLRERGIAEQALVKHIVFAHIGSTVLLIKKSEWTKDELASIHLFAEQNQLKERYFIHPEFGTLPSAVQEWSQWPVMTDDKPYTDTPHSLQELITWLSTDQNNRIQNRPLFDAPLAYLYSIFTVQFLIIGVFGLLVLFLPLLVVQRQSKRVILKRDACYFFLLGFGFIAIELTFLSRLVLIVPEPMTAVAGTISGFLFFAGLGAVSVSKYSREQLRKRLGTILLGALIVILCSFFLVIPNLSRVVAVSSVQESFLLIFLLSAPSAYLLGMPLASYHKIVSNESEYSSGPWLWGINCWASVFGNFASILIARFMGYSSALVIGCIVYLCAFGISFAMRKEPITRKG